MAVGIVHLDLIDSVRHQLLSSQSSTIDTLFLSVPDVLVSIPDLAKRYGDLKNVKLRDDSASILNYHGKPADFGPLVDTRSLFTTLGLKPRFIDVKNHRGYEDIIDLNEPLPAAYNNAFDLVVDSGTLEHCFNVGTAFKNMCASVKNNGWVLTMGPLSMINHGFYNLSPTFYIDGFLDNGFEILFIAIQTKNKLMRLDNTNALSRFVAPPEAVLYCLARRARETPFSWPTQSKYK